MKREQLNWVLAFVLAGSIGIISTQAVASVESKAAAAKKAMIGVPVPELAAKAAALVKQARSEDREGVASAVIEYVAKVHPAAAKSVVSSVAKADPSLAPKVAARAAELLPQDSIALACAAALGARQLAPEVAASVAKAQPKLAADITERLILAVPEEATRTSDAVEKVVSTERSAQASSGNAVVIQRKKPVAPPSSVTGQDTPGFDYARPR